MKILTRSLPFFLFTFCLKANALVDYTETPVAKSTTQMQAPKNESKSLIWKSDFSLNTNYESMEIESKKVGVLNFNTHLQTPFNVYLDLTYWNAQTRYNSQNGNTKAIIGFNWLRFGSPSDEARLDIFTGAKMAGNSDLASSRTDKIFGAETTKRFGTMGLGIGYDITLTGSPHKSDDLSLGNINRISLSGGWMVSNDIQLELEFENFGISSSNDTTRKNYLSKSISFSTFSPKLILTMAPAVSVELGARFRTNKPKSDQDLAAAKLFDLHGAYSNSLFAGLNMNL
jgi:hypothetical protein